MPKFKIHCKLEITKYIDIGDFEAETQEEAKKKALREAYVVLDDEEPYEIVQLVAEEVK